MTEENAPQTPVIETPTVIVETLPPEVIDTSSLMKCYVVLALGLPLTFLPIGPASGLGLFLMIFGTIWAYRLRRKPYALFHNHGSWMVRTVWISSAYFIVALFLSAAIVASRADVSSIEHMGDVLKEGSRSPEEIKAMLDQYHNDNATLLLVTTLICNGIPVLFGVFRFGMGYVKANKGQVIEKLRTWLV